MCEPAREVIIHRHSCQWRQVCDDVHHALGLVRSTHFESMNSFIHASSVFSMAADLRQAEKMNKPTIFQTQLSLLPNRVS